MLDNKKGKVNRQQETGGTFITVINPAYVRECVCVRGIENESNDKGVNYIGFRSINFNKIAFNDYFFSGYLYLILTFEIQYVHCVWGCFSHLGHVRVQCTVHEIGNVEEWHWINGILKQFNEL